jgi:hypothetical protein
LALIAFAALPALAAAASISGTVTDETTDVGIAGIEVCPTPQPYSFEVACTETDSSGHYSLTGLPTANYKLYFSAWLNNLRYVSEYWNDKVSFQDAELVALGSEESRQIDIGLAEGGSVSGTVIDDATKEPIEGLAACAWDTGGFYQRCDKSDATGYYEINGLPSGDYNVEYEGWNQVNYIHEFYEDAETLAQDTKVPVTAPATTSGIDAELARGAEILGHVSEVSSGVPVEGAMVCAPPESVPVAESNQNCDWTDAEGNYAIRGLKAGTYVVGFDVGFAGPFGGLGAGQWWKEASTRAEATVLGLTTPQTMTGIDGKVDRSYWYQPELPGESPPPPTTGSLFPLSATKTPLPRCRKGFHRKLIQGKKRCVRKHRHHRRQHSR